LRKAKRIAKVIVLLLQYLLIVLHNAAFGAQSVEMKDVGRGGDFIDKGYAQIELAVSDLPANAEIEWSAVSVRNRSLAMAEGWEQRITGLSWGEAVPGNTAPIGTIKGNAIILTDIIGERSVVVAAKIKIDEKNITIVQTVLFGKGPLSVFSEPLNKQLSWYEAYKICNGGDYAGEPSKWKIGTGYVGGGKLPRREHLQAVSMPGDKNPVPYAMGAAIAAGWKSGWYWNGNAVMRDRASHVNLNNGTNHGSGGRDVRHAEYITCLKGD
jgi:hypothetical protein